MTDNLFENGKKFHDLCKSYGVYYFINSVNKSYHVSNSYEGIEGCIIPWDHIFVRSPDWEWIEERIIAASLEVFQ